jgi:hypothetical protein
MVMKAKWISLFLVLILAGFFPASCATLEENKGAAVGAGAGAATGALAGALLGKTTGAAVVGGLLGALAGGAIGHYAYDQKKTKEQTVKEYNYQPSQGSMLRIENVTVSPKDVSPGGEVQLSMTYAVLSPSKAGETEITEIREITHNEEVVGNPETRVSRPDGTYTSAIPLRLPAGAEKGEYRVKSTVESARASDQRETSFSVK